ncbi:hypothetical protein FKM82_021300 [Ascaphus truei]
MCLLYSSLSELLHSCSLLHHFSWGPHQPVQCLTPSIPSCSPPRRRHSCALNLHRHLLNLHATLSNHHHPDYILKSSRERAN